MTYLKSALFGSAIALAASSAAFAGDKNMKMETSADGATWTETTMTKSEIMTESKMEMDTSVTSMTPKMDVMGVTTTANTLKNDTIGEVLQADGQPDTQKDYELLTHDGDMLTKSEALAMDSDSKIANNAIVVPSSSGALTTVNCPIGTTAQPDMTCHVTGNYSLETSEALRKQEMVEEGKVLGAVEMNTEVTVTTSEEMDWDNKYNPNKEYLGTLRPDSIK